jgi:hypothetical protein
MAWWMAMLPGLHLLGSWTAVTEAGTSGPFGIHLGS